MSLRLFVGNLPFGATEQELQDYFGAVGPVASVHVVRDTATGRARGFAFVEMASDNDARTAIAQLQGRDFGGRPLTVNEAKPRPERAGGGGRSREPRW
jgi:RNA recognition motif-containing protein